MVNNSIERTALHATAVRRFVASTAVIATVTGIFGSASAEAQAIELPPIDADIVAYLGATFDPTAELIYRNALEVLPDINDGREVQLIQYPAEMWPLTGLLDQALKTSVATGKINVIATIDADKNRNILFVTASQGAVVLSEVKRYLGQLPSDQMPPSDSLTFILVGNPDRPNGGFLSRFSGNFLAWTGFPFGGSTPVDTYTTYDIVNAYDGVSNFPRYPLNLLSTMNAVMGLFYAHPVPPDILNPNADISVSVEGQTTYVTVFPQHLPLLRPLYDGGLGAIADVIEPLIKVWVDAGYDNNDPAANMGVHEQAKLFMPLQNILVALEKSPSAIAEGISTIPLSVQKMLSANRPVGIGENIVSSKRGPRQQTEASALVAPITQRKDSPKALALSGQRISVRDHKSSKGVPSRIARANVSR